MIIVKFDTVYDNNNTLSDGEIKGKFNKDD